MKFQMNRRRWLGLSLAGLAGAGTLGAVRRAGVRRRPRLLRPRSGLGRHRFDAEHIRAGVEWWLRGVDASEEQLAEITRIATASAQELHGLQGAHRAGREQLVDALAGETVDRAALETLRAQQASAGRPADARGAGALRNALSQRRFAARPSSAPACHAPA